MNFRFPIKWVVIIQILIQTGRLKNYEILKNSKGQKLKLITIFSGRLT